MAEIPVIGDSNFEQEVIKSPVPVVVDFFATWCQPCQAIAPIIEEVAEKYQDKVKVVKVDIDNAQDTAVKFGIMSVPTVLFLKDGKEVSRSVGAVPKQVIEQYVKKLL